MYLYRRDTANNVMKIFALSDIAVIGAGNQRNIMIVKLTV